MKRIGKGIVVFSIFILIVYPKISNAIGCEGCCSYHHGIANPLLCHTSTDRLVCNDGEDSPTCSCSCARYLTSPSGGYSSIDGETAAKIIGGLAVGAAVVALLGGLFSNDTDKIGFDRYLEDTKGAEASFGTNKTLDNILLGHYLKKADSCKAFPREFELVHLSVLKRFLETYKNDLLKTVEDKTQRKQAEQMMDAAIAMPVLPIEHAGLADTLDNSFGVNVYFDGSLTILDDDDNVICAGFLSKKNDYKIMKFYCQARSGYCNVKYIHESGKRVN